MLLRVYRILSVALCVTVFSSPASAGEGTEATVSGSGVATLRTAPSRLRMVMALQAVGESPRAVLKNLKTKCEAAVAKLKNLKADEESISFEVPRVTVMGRAIATPAYSSPALMPVAPTPYPAPPDTYTPVPVPTRVTPGKPAKKLPTLHTAMTVLRAEWPLADEGPEWLAATVADIQEKVRTADLGSKKTKQNLSAEERELLEEAQMGMTPIPPYIPSPSMHSSLTGPEFVYVAKFSDAQRKKALAEAFAKAKSEAAELAAAAGMRLGPLFSLSSNRDFSDIYHPNKIWRHTAISRG